MLSVEDHVKYLDGRCPIFPLLSAVSCFNSLSGPAARRPKLSMVMHCISNSCSRALLSFELLCCPP